MQNIKLNVSKSIFNPVYLPFLDETTPTQLFFGGSSSGKSFYLAQRAVLDLAKGGRNYLILRKVQRDCKAGKCALVSTANNALAQIGRAHV